MVAVPDTDTDSSTEMLRTHSRYVSQDRLRGAGKEYPTGTKVLAWAGLTSVQIFAATVLKTAQHDGVYDFSPQSSLVMSETIKVALSMGYLLYDARNVRAAKQAFMQESSPRLVCHMFCLAAIYCFNNGLMFWLFARADPGSITLIKSGATIVSAVMMYIWRRFRLSVPRWMVIIIQMLGLVVAQYDACAGKPHLPSVVYIILFLSLFNSSLANVWNEHVVKNFENASLATKNIHLYLFGAVMNLFVFWYNRISKPDSPAFFEGYAHAALGVVTSNAFMGIAMNVVYKYADALVKNIATTTTTVALLIISAFFFGGRSNPMVFLGAGIVITGTFLYFSLGLSEARTVKLQNIVDRLKSTDEKTVVS